jgi:hypothetical protein
MANRRAVTAECARTSKGRQKHGETGFLAQGSKKQQETEKKVLITQVATFGGSDLKMFVVGL